MQVVGRRNAAGVLELIARNEDDGLFTALDSYLRTYRQARVMSSSIYTVPRA